MDETILRKMKVFCEIMLKTNKEGNMFKGSYFTISLLLIIIALVVANCGGGSDTGAVPGIPQSQSEQFMTKNISGIFIMLLPPKILKKIKDLSS